MGLNEGKLNELLGKVVGDLAAGYGGVMVSLGDKLGLYKAMKGAGPLSSHEVAKRSGCAERYVREWLNSQVAAGYIDYHPKSATYELSAEQAYVLAEDTITGVHSDRLAGRLPRCGSTSRRRSRRSAPARACRGASTTSGCSAGWRRSTAMPIAAAWSANGCRRSTASRQSSSAAPKWPTSAAATAIRRC